MKAPKRSLQLELTIAIWDALLHNSIILCITIYWCTVYEEKNSATHYIVYVSDHDGLTAWCFKLGANTCMMVSHNNVGQHIV